MKKANNNHNLLSNRLVGLLSLMVVALVACTPTSAPPKTALDDQPAHMVSAFFGLDNDIKAFRYKGADGMPVTFSKRVENPDSLVPEMFTVVTRLGKRAHPLRVTTRPANEATKRHTILLIGEFGNEPEDPPVKVEVTGHLILAGGDDALGLSVDVTPLEQGPSMVMAYTVKPEDFHEDMPATTKQVVVTVWDGGVTLMDGITTESHRIGYAIETADGNTVHPIAIGDIGDDNYEYLYLNTEAMALRVSLKGGLLMDPRSDTNLATSVEVAGASTSDLEGI